MKSNRTVMHILKKISGSLGEKERMVHNILTILSILPVKDTPRGTGMFESNEVTHSYVHPA